jgi:hypothetical protein
MLSGLYSANASPDTSPVFMSRRTIHRALACSLLIVGGPVWGADPPVAPGLIPPPPAAATATNVAGPRIQFETPVYDFGRAQSGDQVKYSYVFTNTGDQVLEISGVQACGCITANWTKSVQPGKTGSVPISFNSASYMGPVIKAVNVTCNDKAHPQTSLQFKGTVWKPVDVIPQMAVLNLTADSPLASTSVRVTNNLPEPVTLSAPESDNRLFTAELKTIQEGKEFEVTISPVSLLPQGMSRALVTLKTSSTNVPVVSIPVYANVQPAVTIVPAQVVLPPGPLAQPHTASLDIIDNSTNLIVLFEPRVSATGVEVQMKEVVPGKKFSATLTFPQGFEIPQGQRAELSIKTSHSIMPLIKAPIFQPSRPMPPRTPPPGFARQVQQPISPSTNKHRPLGPIEMPPLPP